MCRPSVVAFHFELSTTVVLHCGHSGRRIQNVTLVGSTAAFADFGLYELTTPYLTFTSVARSQPGLTIPKIVDSPMTRCVHTEFRFDSRAGGLGA
jgi:hypothetical protein